jgi:transposase
MRKKHSFEDRLKYMGLLKEGYSINYIKEHYGFNSSLLSSLWEKYQEEGKSALLKKRLIKASVEKKLSAINDYERNGLSLVEVMLKYGVSQSAFNKWRKSYAEGGLELLQQDRRGRPPKTMGRPKKKEPQTEFEKLQEENRRLKAENALLKKVKALVEARDAQMREIGRKPSKN